MSFVVEEFESIGDGAGPDREYFQPTLVQSFTSWEAAEAFCLAKADFFLMGDRGLKYFLADACHWIEIKVVVAIDL